MRYNTGDPTVAQQIHTTRISYNNNNKNMQNHTAVA